MRKGIIVGVVLVAIVIAGAYSFSPQQSITEPKFVFSRAEYDRDFGDLIGDITLTVTNRGATAIWTLVQEVWYDDDGVAHISQDIYWIFDWDWDQGESYIMWESIWLQAEHQYKEGDVIYIRVFCRYPIYDVDGFYDGMLEKEVFLEYKFKKGDV